jgi:formylglycine-generating enzyme required for sulfatase activity
MDGNVAMATDAARARSGEPKAKIFISYSRKDMAFADKLEAALKSRGFEVLIDREEIYAFEDWWKRIEVLINGSDTVVFVLSPDAVKSDVAIKEVSHAASLNKRFAPIVCQRVEDSAVPEALRRLNFIFFNDPDTFDASADKLAEALQTDISWIRRHTEFGDAAHRWVETGRPSGMLLRPPMLDQAEAWLTFRPHGAPAPTAETELFIAQSRKAVLDTQRLRRVVAASMFTLLIGIILGLVGWINQAYIADQWRYWTVTWPYAQVSVWPHVLTAEQERVLKTGDTFKECAQDCPQMIVVPAGSFTMGGYSKVLKPQHVVVFSRQFAVAELELTFADWDACVSGGGCNRYRPNDQGWGRRQQPVINVNWDDAQAYVAWLSLVTGKAYRLLSEAEYEYAARAGSTTAYPWGDAIGTNNANCDGCSSKWDAEQTAPAGSFAPNKFGLYDMVGNVWEWTEDCLHVDYNGAPSDGSAWLEANDGDCSNRMMRGGSFSDSPNGIRSSSRGWNTTNGRNSIFGVRIARTLLTP